MDEKAIATLTETSNSKRQVAMKFLRETVTDHKVVTEMKLS